MLSHNFRFKDRVHAGKKLGERLLGQAFLDPIILALPRGGVTVADQVARILNSSLDVVIARKIGAPGQEEFGIGAMSEDEVPHFNPSMTQYFDISGREVQNIVRSETEELRRRIAHYRGGRELPSLKGKTVILIDDGLATGVTAAAAGTFLRTQRPKELIFAAPVCPQIISSEVRQRFDEIICLESPRNFQAVGLWYEDFPQIEDEEVMFILNKYHLNIQIPKGDAPSNLEKS